MLAFMSINLELIYILIATGVILVGIYFLRRFIITKNEDEDMDEVLDEEQIAREELESMIVHENIILEDKDIEKEVARDNYNLDEVNEDETKED